MAEELQPTWTDWRGSVFGEPYLVWHDGPDFGQLFLAYNESAEQVDRMLAAGVVEKDSLAAECIGRLEPEQGVPRALAALVAAQVPASGEFALRRAQALFAVSGDTAHHHAMIQILEGDDHWGVRINAAIAIGELEPTAQAIDALERAVASPDYLVRYHSANALLKYTGREPDISLHALFEAIASPRDDTEATKAHRRAWIAAGRELASEARAAR